MARQNMNRWSDMLPPPGAAQEWEALKPGLAAEIFEESLAEERHRRRLATARVATKILGQFLALGSVALMVLIAKYALDAGEPIVAGFAIGAPSVSLAVIFALSRAPDRRLTERLGRAARSSPAAEGGPPPPLAAAPEPGDPAQTA